MSSNRRADASRRKKGIYTRQELIKKHGRKNLEEVFLKLTREKHESQ